MEFIRRFIPFNYKKFWEMRYKEFGNDIRYCGNKALTKEQNTELYKRNIMNFEKEIKDYVNKDSKILEIGCGNGLYTDYFYRNRFKNYRGIDLNNDLIIILKEKYKEYYFENTDICKEKIIGKYDFIFMIDVMFHIVKDKYSINILNNIKGILNNDGVFMVNDDIRKPNSYYIKRREFSFYETNLGLKAIKNTSFNGKELYIFQKD